VVWVDLVLPGPDIDGDELAVVLGPQRRPDPMVEYLGPKSGEFLGGTGFFVGRHGQSPSGTPSVSVRLRADLVTDANLASGRRTPRISCRPRWRCRIPRGGRMARPVSCIRWFGLAIRDRQRDPRRS